MNNQSNLAAKILFDHRMNKKGMKSLPKSLIPESIEEAYKIQDELKLLYLSLKDNYCIGKKNGCTNSVAQKQINIFEPFYTTKDPGKGVGLGLSISAELASKFGGKLTANNLEKAGSQFILEIKNG